MAFSFFSKCKDRLPTFTTNGLALAFFFFFASPRGVANYVSKFEGEEKR